MSKRYQVFVSSTYQDLSEERLEVIKALLELDCIPCGMEYFPAASEESWSYIASLIEECDYYIVIVGGRYGSLTPEGISFTQKEYEYALSQNVPAIAFLHANPADLPVRKTESDEAGRKKLSDFVLRLKNHLCKEWSSSHELGAVVSRSLTQLIKRHPRTGWIPADQASSPEATQEILELTKKVRQLEDDLNHARGKKVVEIKNLSDEDETVVLEFACSILMDDPNSNYHRSITVRNTVDSIVFSWNDLFQVISPKLAPTASDASVRTWISVMIDERYNPGPEKLKTGEYVGRASLSTKTFHIIKIQFLALGLVTTAKERAEDSKKAVLLWRLTEKGEKRMYQILAVRRDM